MGHDQAQAPRCAYRRGDRSVTQAKEKPGRCWNTAGPPTSTNGAQSMHGNADTTTLASSARMTAHERRLAQRDAFSIAFHDWLSARAELEDPRHKEDVRIDQLLSRVDALSREILAMPAPYLWVVARKIEVLEDLLASSGVPDPLVGLGGIRADVIRFEHLDHGAEA